eukprot:1067571-Prymnesium_polylepis.1
MADAHRDERDVAHVANRPRLEWLGCCCQRRGRRGGARAALPASQTGVSGAALTPDDEPAGERGGEWLRERRPEAADEAGDAGWW